MLRNGLAAKGMCEATGHWLEIREVLHGEQGDELRRNAEELKRNFEKAWEEGDGRAQRVVGTVPLWNMKFAL